MHVGNGLENSNVNGPTQNLSMKLFFICLSLLLYTGHHVVSLITMINSLGLLI